MAAERRRKARSDDDERKAAEEFDRAVAEALGIGVTVTLVRAFAAALRDRSLNAAPRAVLVALAEHVGQETAVAFPSRQRLADLTGYSAKTVSNALWELRSAGFVIWKRGARPDGRPGQVMLYCVRPPPADTAAETAPPAGQSRGTPVDTAPSAGQSIAPRVGQSHAPPAGHRNLHKEITSLKQPPPEVLDLDLKGVVELLSWLEPKTARGELGQWSKSAAAEFGVAALLAAAERIRERVRDGIAIAHPRAYLRKLAGDERDNRAPSRTAKGVDVIECKARREVQRSTQVAEIAAAAGFENEWRAFRREFAKSAGEDVAAAWLDGGAVVDLDGAELMIVAENKFKAGWLNEKHGTAMEVAARAACGAKIVRVVDPDDARLRQDPASPLRTVEAGQ